MWTFAATLKAELNQARVTSSQRRIEDFRAHLEELTPELYALAKLEHPSYSLAASQSFFTPSSAAAERALQEAAASSPQAQRSRVQIFKDGRTQPSLNQTIVREANHLSATLELNQITCAGLILDAKAAVQMPESLSDVSHVAAATHLFFKSKQVLLSILAALLEDSFAQTALSEFHLAAKRYISSLPNLGQLLLKLAATEENSSIVPRLTRDVHLKPDALKTINASREALESEKGNLVLIHVLLSPLRDLSVGVRRESPFVELLFKEWKQRHSAGKQGFVTSTLFLCLVDILFKSRVIEQQQLEAMQGVARVEGKAELTAFCSRCFEGDLMQHTQAGQILSLSWLVANEQRNVMDTWAQVIERPGMQTITAANVFSFFKDMVQTARFSNTELLLQPVVQIVMRFLEPFVDDISHVKMLSDNGQEFDDLIALSTELFRKCPLVDADVSLWDGLFRIAGTRLSLENYNAYLKMLKEVASSRSGADYLTDLLSENGRPGNSNAPVSWRQLFEAARSYAQEPPQDDASLSMFVYFIELTTRVMQHGSSSAAQLYRMPADRETWLVYLLQLYCAQFDAATRGALLSCVSMLCERHEEAAREMWFLLLNNAEFLLIGKLGCLGDIVFSNNEGILSDYNLQEKRARCYPESRAFVNLIRVLAPVMQIDAVAGIPKWRLRVYSDYLIKEVFHKLLSQLEYANAMEQWQFVSSTLESILALLQLYTPRESDFVRPPPTTNTGPVLGTPAVSDGERDRFHHLEGPRYIGLSVLLHFTDDVSFHSLNAIRDVLHHGRTLSQQDSGVDELLQQSIATALSILDVIFQRVHTLKSLAQPPRVSINEFLANTFSYQGQSSSMIFHLARMLEPETPDSLALMAARVLYFVAQGQSTLGPVLRSIQPRALLQIKSFLQYRLKDIQPSNVQAEEDPEDWQQIHLDVTGKAHSSACNATAVCLLKFLDVGLQGSVGGNATPAFLGFKASATSKQEITNAVLSLSDVVDGASCLHVISEWVAPSNDKASIAEAHPELGKSMLSFLCNLCSHPVYRQPVLLYFREHTPFHARLGKALAVLVAQHAALSPQDASASTSCIALLLSLFTAELFTSEDTSSSSVVQQIINDVVFSSSANQLTLLTDAQGATRDVSLLARLISSIVFEQPELGLPVLQSTPRFTAEQMLQQAMVQRDEHGRSVTLLDASAISRTYETYGASVGNAGAAVTEQLKEDMASLLRFSVHYNVIAQLRSARHHLVESMYQFLHVVFSKDLQTVDAVQRLSLMSQTTLQLLSKLPRDMMSAQAADTLLLSAASDALLSLVSTIYATLDTPSALPQSSSELAISVLRSLQEHLLHMIVLLSTFPESTVRIRRNAYGLLHYLMRMCDMAGSEMPPQFLRSPDPRFRNTLCDDACSEHSATSSLAMTVLSDVLVIDDSLHWLSFLHKQGHLTRHSSAIIASDKQLVQILRFPQLVDADTLHLHQVRCRLLLRCCESAHGAQLVYETGFLSKLCQCQFLGVRPVVDPAAVAESRAQQSYEFHHEVMNSVLALLVEIVRQNTRMEVVRELQLLLKAHGSRYFRNVVRDSASALSGASLQELQLVTCLFSMAAMRQFTAGMDEQELERVCAAMLALLCKFSNIERWRKVFAQIGVELECIFLQVLENVSLFLRRQMDSTKSKQDLHSGVIKTVFHPSFETHADDAIGMDVLVRLLQGLEHTCQDSQRELQRCESQIEKRREGSAAGGQQMGESYLNTSIQHDLLDEAKLVALRDSHQQVLDTALRCVDSVLYLLWRHIYFFIRVAPFAPQDSFVLRGVRNIKGVACIESFQIPLTSLTDHQSQTHAYNYGQSAQESDFDSSLSYDKLNDLKIAVENHRLLSGESTGLLATLAGYEKRRFEKRSLGNVPSFVQPLVTRFGRLVRELRAQRA